MLRVLRAEFVKLKRSKVLLGSLGVVVFFALMSMWGMQLAEDAATATWEAVLNGSPMYMAAWWGTLIFSMAAANLFGAEFSEGTAASMLTTPIRRDTIVTAKMIVLAAWVAALALVSVVATVVVAVLMGAEAFSWEALWEAAGQSFQVAFMLYLTLPVVALISLFGKGYVAPMLFSSAMVAANIAAGFLDLEQWFPWTMPSTVAGGMAPPSALVGELPPASWAILGVMFALGLAGVYWYVYRVGEQ